jgi:hypothetical protein
MGFGFGQQPAGATGVHFHSLLVVCQVIRCSSVLGSGPLAFRVRCDPTTRFLDHQNCGGEVLFGLHKTAQADIRNGITYLSILPLYAVRVIKHGIVDL